MDELVDAKGGIRVAQDNVSGGDNFIPIDKPKAHSGGKAVK
jgi:hypothetical protein